MACVSYCGTLIHAGATAFAWSPRVQRSSASVVRMLQRDARGPQGTRGLAEKVWRRKQDHWAKQAKASGLRSRAAFKLEQINAKTKLLRPGKRVVDLGAAPGGWTIVATEFVNPDPKAPWIPPRSSVEPASRVPARRTAGAVVCCDLLPMDSVRGASFVQGDFLDAEVRARVMAAAGATRAGVDVVLSDMAPNTSGNAARDHAQPFYRLRRGRLRGSEAALRPGGAFLVKIFNGAQLHPFLAEVKKAFGQVKIHKPDASRSESSELFVHAAAFRGRALREIAAQQGEGEVGVAGGPPPVMPGGAARGGARENA